jgi:NADH:ubiquinone oxidoreductase subunit 3 (subunit A)
MIGYFNILLILAIAVFLAIVLVLLSYFISVKKEDPEKLSPYECGFDPFDDARNNFDIRFYLVAILFIVFDIEVTFLFPWTLTVHSLPILGIVSMFAFLIILTIGFVYEWRKGGLEWN